MPKPHLTDKQKKAVRELYEAGCPATALAVRFNITRRHVYRLIDPSTLRYPKKGTK